MKIFPIFFSKLKFKHIFQFNLSSQLHPIKQKKANWRDYDMLNNYITFLYKCQSIWIKLFFSRVFIFFRKRNKFQFQSSLKWFFSVWQLMWGQKCAEDRFINDVLLFASQTFPSINYSCGIWRHEREWHFM